MKRKVADMPPVTAENFQSRVLAHASKLSEKNDDEEFVCTCCKKHFGGKSTYYNHLKSKKHLEIATKNSENSMSSEEAGKTARLSCKVTNTNHVDNRPGKDIGFTSVVPKLPVERSNTNPFADELSDEEEWEDVDEDALTILDCLFCTAEHESMEENMKHMTTAHSFFLPDIEYLVDLEGLVAYLGEKISCGKLCLWCNEKSKSFYSIKSVQQHMIDKGHCKMLHDGDALVEYADFYDYSPSYPDHDAVDPNQMIDANVLSDEDFQLVLPSGATIGHRSLMKYYRQNIPPNRREQSKKLVPRLLAHYRALGWSGTTQEVTSRRARDISYMQTVRSKQMMQQGVRNNKLQKHMRSQILI